MHILQGKGSEHYHFLFVILVRKLLFLVLPERRKR